MNILPSLSLQSLLSGIWTQEHRRADQRTHGPCSKFMSTLLPLSTFYPLLYSQGYSFTHTSIQWPRWLHYERPSSWPLRAYTPSCASSPMFHTSVHHPAASTHISVAHCPRPHHAAQKQPTAPRGGRSRAAGTHAHSPAWRSCRRKRSAMRWCPVRYSVRSGCCPILSSRSPRVRGPVGRGKRGRGGCGRRLG